MQRTRWEILAALRRGDGATVADLAQQLNLHPASVRSHLAALRREGVVAVEEVRGKVGRPAHRYALTASGLSHFPTRHYELLKRLVVGLQTVLGEDTLRQVVAGAAERLAAEHRTDLAGVELSERVPHVARLLASAGVEVSWERAPEGWLIHARNRPHAHLARGRPFLQQLDAAFLSHLLETTVEVLRAEPPGVVFLVHAPPDAGAPEEVSSSSSVGDAARRGGPHRRRTVGEP
jgi:predicted ArsR family transcriptional regulator